MEKLTLKLSQEFIDVLKSLGVDDPTGYKNARPSVIIFLMNMDTVYRASRTILSQEQALKVLRQTWEDTNELIKNLKTGEQKQCPKCELAQQTQCEICFLKYDSIVLYTCPRCGKKCCDDCAFFCEICQQYYCKDHFNYKKDTCVLCAENGQGHTQTIKEIPVEFLDVVQLSEQFNTKIIELLNSDPVYDAKLKKAMIYIKNKLSCAFVELNNIKIGEKNDK